MVQNCTSGPKFEKLQHVYRLGELVHLYITVCLCQHINTNRGMFNIKDFLQQNLRSESDGSRRTYFFISFSFHRVQSMSPPCPSSEKF